MTFYQRLATETAAEQLVLASTPQIVDGLQGLISLETYIAYLTEAFHHVKHTTTLMRAAQRRLDMAHRLFAEALGDYIAEETGHEEWILDDIAHCGGDREAVRNGVPRPATLAMTDYAYDFIARVNPMGLFGMIFVLEGTSVQLADKGASAVARTLGLGPECFTYLTSHGALDVEHLRFFEDLMNRVEDPEDQAAIIDAAKAIFIRFADVFRSIPHRREVVDACR